MSTGTRPIRFGIRFGALLRQADNRWQSIAESARIAEATGFASIHFIDHLLAIPDPTGDILESWTTLSACAGITQRVRLSANVRKKVGQGITSFVCLFTDGGQPETVRLFGERVIPAFR